MDKTNKIVLCACKIAGCLIYWRTCSCKSWSADRNCRLERKPDVVRQQI